MRLPRKPALRRDGTNLFIERGKRADAGLVAVLVLLFVLLTGQRSYDADVTAALRGQLYGSLAATAGALLGFVLAALAILVAVPSGERLQALRSHHSWHDVTGSYFRAAACLLSALIICTLGIAVDADTKPWIPYEVVTVGVLAYALSRIIGAIFALDIVLRVSEQTAPLQRGAVKDPGP